MKTYSVKAGEIERRWYVVDAQGKLLEVGEWIELSHDITKGKRPDTQIKMHPMLYDALVALRALDKTTPFLCYAPFGGSMSVNNVTVYLHQLYDRVGFEGCSSHSGRRTFITTLARTANEHKCSIKDVQLLARHSSMRSTERYIEPSIRIHELALSI